MTILPITTLLSQPFDCLIIVHPHIDILESATQNFLETGLFSINIGKELSTALIPTLYQQRGASAQSWLQQEISSSVNEPVFCENPHLLFDPSFNIDPLTLFRQVAHIKKIIVPWLGEYRSKRLSYAEPNHLHYKTWDLSEPVYQQPRIVVHRIVD